MGLAYAYPPFTLLATVLTKIACERGRVVLRTPDWGRSGEHAYLRRLPDQMSVVMKRYREPMAHGPEACEPSTRYGPWPGGR